MEIKTANNAADSTTLKAAKGTDRMAIAILASAFIVGVGWFVTPPKYKAEVQDKVFPAVLAGMFAVGAVIKSNIVRIVDGRLKVGDLDEQVKHVALLASGEMGRLETLKPFLEGKTSLLGLPDVQLAIQKQVEAKTQTFEDAIASKLDQFKPVTFPADVPTALPVVPAGVIIPTPTPGLTRADRNRKTTLSELATIATGAR